MAIIKMHPFDGYGNYYKIKHIGNVILYKVYYGKRAGTGHEVWARTGPSKEWNKIGGGKNYGVYDALADARNHCLKPIKIKPYTGGEILAVRAWGLRGDLLVPVTRDADFTTWSGPVATAHEIPSDHNSSGLYCVRPSPHAVSQLLSNYTYNLDAYGIVALSGRVLEYEKGYRAQRATIRKLIIIPPVSDEFLELLGDRYQSDVVRERPDARHT